MLALVSILLDLLRRVTVCASVRFDDYVVVRGDAADLYDTLGAYSIPSSLGCTVSRRDVDVESVFPVVGPP